jgi:DNA-binding response OmpR family regulator
MSTHVLIVDDNQELAENLAELLTDEGYLVVTASSGEEALGLAAGQRFDFVLTDICMPAHASDELLANAGSLGIAEAVLPKPLVIEALLARLLGAGGDQILLVEGDVTLSEVLAAQLRARGHAVRVVHSLADARAAIAECLPALAVVDVVLPDGSSIALIQELRTTGSAASGVPVVLLTGSTKLDRDALRGLACDEIQFLDKPVAPEALVHVVERLAHAG